MSESFKNWRVCLIREEELRNIIIRCIINQVLNKKEIDELKIILIEDYINEKVKTIENANRSCKEIGDISSVPTNQRRLTNLGTFRHM